MAAVPPDRLSDVLITEQLHRRVPHNADYKREKLAIQELARDSRNSTHQRAMGHHPIAQVIRSDRYDDDGGSDSNECIQENAMSSS